MPIKKRTPPKEVMDLVHGGTEASRRVATMHEHHITDDQSPHPVFTLSVEDIAAGRRYEGLRQIGWRVFHHEDEEAAVEIYSDESGTMHQYGGVNRGPFVQGTKAALDEVDRLEDLGDHDFHLNVLKIPALYIMALWLQHADPDRDLIVPIEPARAGLQAGRPYTWDQFIGEVQPEAQALLDHDHQPAPEEGEY